MVSNRQPLVDALMKDFLEQSRGVMAAAAPRLKDNSDEVVEALRVFFNKWVVEIVVVLSGAGEPVRFNELKGKLAGISSRTLSERLKELEQQGIVKRQLFDERPVRVEYSLTKKGTDVASLALPLVLYLLK